MNTYTFSKYMYRKGHKEAPAHVVQHLYCWSLKGSWYRKDISWKRAQWWGSDQPEGYCCYRRHERLSQVHVEWVCSICWLTLRREWPVVSLLACKRCHPSWASWLQEVLFCTSTKHGNTTLEYLSASLMWKKKQARVSNHPFTQWYCNSLIWQSQKKWG